MNVLKIVAEIEIKPEYREKLIPVLKRLVDGSRSEPGNRKYELTEDIDRVGHFFVLEEWESKKAIEEHNESPHFRAFTAAIEGKTEKLSIAKAKILF